MEHPGRSAKIPFMTLMRWGRGLLIWGLAAAAATFLPVLVIDHALPGLSQGIIGLVAVLLALSVTPVAVLTASVGAILLLVALARRDRF